MVQHFEMSFMLCDRAMLDALAELVFLLSHLSPNAEFQRSCLVVLTCFIVFIFLLHSMPSGCFLSDCKAVLC